MAGYKEERGKNTWLLVVSDGFDANGNRIKHTDTFKGTEKQADIALAMFVADVKRGVYQKPQKMIARDLFRRWLDTYGKFNHEESTLEGNERYLMNRVSPSLIRKSKIEFGKVDVNQLKSSDFYDLYNYLRKKYKYKNKTILQVHRILHSAFTEALSWVDVQLPSHPMKGVKAPTPETKPIVRIKENEVTTFLNTAYKNAPFWFFVFLSIDFLAGLRRGEILGLRWQDIKSTNKLTIWQAVRRTKASGVHLSTPKSGQPRTVEIPNDLIVLLNAFRYKVESEKGKQPDDALLFTMDDGSLMYPEKATHLIKRFREKHNLPDITIHGGRHSNASILINKGATLKEVSEHLGHSTTQITDVTYTEVWEEQKNALAGKMEGILPNYTSTRQAPKSENKIIHYPFKQAK